MISNRLRLRNVIDSISSTGVMAHLVAGYPDPSTTIAAAKAIEAGGAAVLELQLPFSDPVADGPSILAASHEALASGMTHAKSLEILERLSREVSLPVLVMCYANLPFVRGFDRFAEEIADRGVTGLIVPDLPFTEPEFDSFYRAIDQRGVSYVPVIAPTTEDAIIGELDATAKDLMYVVIRLGVTGQETSVNLAVQERLHKVGSLTSCPLAAGFGIGSRQQVEMIEARAKLVVVGTKIVNLLRENREQAPIAIEALIKTLVA